MSVHAIEDQRPEPGGSRNPECGHTHTSPTPLLLPEDLRDRRAVVTGAARGIGEAIAKWLIMAGADVTVVDKDQKSLKLAFGDEPCQILEGDLGADDVVGLADDLARHAPVELIVNNVGVSTRHGFLDIGMPEFDLHGEHEGHVEQQPVIRRHLRLSVRRQPREHARPGGRAAVNAATAGLSACGQPARERSAWCGEVGEEPAHARRRDEVALGSYRASARSACWTASWTAAGCAWSSCCSTGRCT